MKLGLAIAAAALIPLTPLAVEAPLKRRRFWTMPPQKPCAAAGRSG